MVGSSVWGTEMEMKGIKEMVREFLDEILKERKKEKGLLTIEEAAKFLNVKISWLRQAIFRREIDHIKVGALVRFREDDLNKFVRKNLKSFGA